MALPRNAGAKTEFGPDVKKTAVILFNLGGPTSLDNVRPFLFRLFNDPAILCVPQPLRFFLAQLISRRREKIARAIYARLGGSSPILANTEAQARALEKALNSNQGVRHSAFGIQQNSQMPNAECRMPFKCFIAMRYARPFAIDAAAAAKQFAPDEIVLLPLYPQFSTATTKSSFKDWQKAARKARLAVPVKIISDYPEEPGFVAALAALARPKFAEAAKYGKPRLLMSAHGLPEKIVSKGDPYPAQCVQTARALARALGLGAEDWVLCYQSRVGPLKWIGPSTDDEIRRAGRDKAPVAVVPIAFVSEHSETLVEIDRDYRELARACGVPFFAYTGAAGTAPEFIGGLASLVRKALI